MKNIFFVSELFYPNQTSTAYIITEIAKNFANKGQNVKVITAKIQYDSNIIVEEKLGNIDLYEIKSIRGNKNSFLERIMSAFYNSFALGWKTFVKAGRKDIVFAVTNPPFLIILLAIINKIKRFNYVLLVHDVFPENTIPAGINKKSSFFYKILLYVYNWAYRSPSKIIVLGEDMRHLIQNKGVKEEKIAVIPNWFDKDLDTTCINRNDERCFSEEIIIGFAGNVGRVQALERFIAIFNKVENDCLKLEIVGEGAALESCKRKSINKNISFLGSVPRNEQHTFINRFDIGLITLSEGMYGLGVPSKTYNLLAMGKPILFIGDCGSEIDLLNKNEKIGWSFDWQDENLILTFLNLLKKEDIISFKTTNQSLAQKKFSANIILEKIDNFVTN